MNQISSISSSSARNTGASNAGATQYTVHKGDTLSDIAARHGISLSALQSANPKVAAQRFIFAGDKLTIPQGNIQTHTVTRGETLTSIAQQNGTTVAALMKTNPEIRNADQIYPGQVVRFPSAEGSITAKAAPTSAEKAPAAQAEAAPAVRSDDVLTKLGDALATGEGNYESYNTGTKGVDGGRVGHSYLNPSPGTVTNKTINEILATRSRSGYDTDRMFATGKYQTTLDTLAAAKKAMGLTGNERYTPEMQERVFREFLLQKAGGGKLAAFVNRGEGTVETAQYAAAKEWASIAVPSGLAIGDGRISDGTLSYYDKRGTNSASMTATNALRDVLSNIDRSPAAVQSPASAEIRQHAAGGTIDGNVEASRNGISVKSAAVRLTRLDANMQPVFAAVAQAARELGLPNPVITSGNDSTHKNGSLHYQNQALDFRGNTITQAQGQRLEDRVKELLGGKFDVDFEVFPSRPTNNHLHVEYDPN